MKDITPTYSRKVPVINYPDLPALLLEKKRKFEEELYKMQKHEKLYNSVCLFFSRHVELGAEVDLQSWAVDVKLFFIESKSIHFYLDLIHKLSSFLKTTGDKRTGSFAYFFSNNYTSISGYFTIGCQGIPISIKLQLPLDVPGLVKEVTTTTHTSTNTTYRLDEAHDQYVLTLD